MKLKDLYKFIKNYLDEIVASKFKGTITLVVNFGPNGGIGKVEVVRRELVG